MEVDRFNVTRWLVLFLIIGVAVASSRAAPQETGRAGQLIEQAERDWYLGAFTSALTRTEQALRLGEQLSDPRLVATCLNLIGNVSDSQGHYARGWEYHQRALAQAREINDQQLEASILADIGLGYWRQSDYVQAHSHCRQALTIQEQIGDHLGQATTLVYIGRVHFKQGAYDQALEYYRRARTIQEAAGDRPGQSVTLEDVGDVYQEKGAYAQALEYYTQALRIREETEDRAGQCYMLHIIGRCYMLQGAYQVALGYFRRALRLAHEINDRSGRAQALYHLGIAYSRQGAYARALSCYQSALRIRAALGDRRAQAWDLAHAGDAHYRLGDVTQALTCYQRAIKIWEEIRDQRGLAGGVEKTARLYYDLGDYQQALKYYQRAEKLRAETQPAFLAPTLANMGKLYAAQGQAQEALAYGQRAVEIAEQIQDLEVQWTAAYVLGCIQRQLDRRLEALASFRESLAIIERLRAGVVPVDEAKAGFLDSRQAAYADTISLLMELGRTAEALELAERARARAFLDLLGGRELQAKPIDMDTLAHIRQLQNELQRPASIRASTPSVSREIARRGDEVVRAELSQFLQAQPELTSFVTVPPPSLPQLQETARRRHATLLEYFVTDAQLFIWIVRPDGTIRATSSQITRRELNRRVQQMHRAMQSGIVSRRVRPLLRRLHQVLIEPVEAWLPDDPDQLVTIMPHGSLFLVSFAALLDEHGRYFIERHTLNYSPAISVLQYTGSKQQRVVHRAAPHLLVVGNPAMARLPEPLPRLPPLSEAEAEVRAISQLYPAHQVTTLVGARAQERLVRELAPEQTMIHLATHGVIRDDEPLESLLALAPEMKDQRSGIRDQGLLTTDNGQRTADSDGLLTMREVFQLDLSADLVVLSACNTGLGQISGDGVIGLSRAFIYAGTPSVMVSLWPVADIVTKFEMEQFYRWLRDNGGNKAAALRQAQLATLRKLRQHRLRTPSGKFFPEHPIYWAPFVLIGEAH